MVERLRPGVSARKVRVCIFDFDGTISLIRSGWMDVMLPMMVEILLDLKTGESEEELRRVVEDFVWRLTGKQTIYQMIELARQIATRGGQPRDPLVYKKMYLDRLHDRIRHRLEELASRARSRPKNTWFRARANCSQALRARGLALYLASGTDQEYMREEARLLDSRAAISMAASMARSTTTGVSPSSFSSSGSSSPPGMRGRRVSGLRRRLRGNRERQGSRRRGRRGRHRRAGMPSGGPMEAPASGRRGRGLHHSQFPLPRGTAATPCSPMASKYSLFDRSRLRLQPAGRTRSTSFTCDHWLALDEAPLRLRASAIAGRGRAHPGSAASAARRASS